jgi:isopenicillin-N epimerase
MPSEFRHLWDLDPQVMFLNHGSFGAAPRAVLAAQQAWRDRLEAEPVRFFSVDLEPAMDAARSRLGAFVGADPEGLAFVPNATTGVNTVLRSLRFEPGDELVTTDHAYNAVRNVLDFVSRPAGATVVTVPVPFPISSPDEVVEAVMGAVTPRTRLAVLDHVTSATALVYPIGQLIDLLHQRGVQVLVDGAHAPGMLDLDIGLLNADFYAANLHKWVCAPKGSGFVFVREDHRDRIRPLVISHGANSPRGGRTRFRNEFDWMGTGDPTPYLAAADAIAYLESLMPGGWPAIRARNHALALAGRDLLTGALGIEAPAPDEMVGTMASIPLPFESGPFVVQGVDLSADPIQGALLRNYGMQTMITPWPQRPTDGPWRRLIRISAALHDDIEQMEALASALKAVLAAR